MCKKAACYIRVSTSEQTEFSPAAQLKAIKKYAEANHITLLTKHIYVDESSGKTAEKRVEFMKMINEARKKPKAFEIILVHRFDRFARSREDSVVYKSILKKEAGIRVISVTESIEDDKFSVILEAMLEAMAEYYSLNLADEVKKGMTEKALRGEFQATPPLGYTIIDKVLIPIENEVILVKNIFYQYAVKGLSFREIAMQMNMFGARTKKGNFFDGRAIAYILHNPVYIGMVRWTPNGRTDRDFSNSSSITSQGNFEPIIPIELWNRTKDRLESDGKLYSNKHHTAAITNTWLKGIIKCGNCGSLLVSNGTAYLQCSKYVKGQCCVSHSINYSYAEEIILKHLDDIFKDKIIFTPKNNTKENNSEIKFVSSKIKETDKRIQRVKEAYLSGADTLEEYLSQKKELISQKNNLENQLNLICNSKFFAENSRVYSSVTEFLKEDDISIMSKCRAIHLIFDEIVFDKYNGSLILKYRKY